MHITLIRSSSKIGRKMILHVNNLCHVFHLMTHSLSLMGISTAAWSKRSDTICQILILWSWRVSFESIEIELIFVWCSTDRSFIHLMRAHLLSSFFIIYYLSRISHLVKLTTDIHRVRLCLWVSILLTIVLCWGCWTWLRNLSIVSTRLRSSFNLVLNLLSLFFIWLSDRNTLTDLLLLRSIQRMHLVMWSHH